MPCSARHSASKASDMQELSVVMSGFDPYEDVTANPALIIPDALAEQGMGGAMDDDDDLKDVAITVHAVHMPVSFSKAWPILEAALEEHRPQIVVATGLKGASVAFCWNAAPSTSKTRAGRTPTTRCRATM